MSEALDAWHKWFQENCEMPEWIGPCVHGRDPFTRCDICGELTEQEARKLAEGAPPQASPSPATPEGAK